MGFPNDIHQIVARDIDDKLLAAQDVLRCPMREIAPQSEQRGFKSHHGEPTFGGDIRLPIFVEAGDQHDLSQQRGKSPGSFVRGKAHFFFHGLEEPFTQAA
jgi:hypothetical protein